MLVGEGALNTVGGGGGGGGRVFDVRIPNNEID